MAEKLCRDFIKVAEIVISNIDTLKHFRTNVFEAFLIGENFMKTENPALACKDFIGQI